MLLKQKDDIDLSAVKFYDLDKFNLTKESINTFLNFVNYLKDIKYNWNPIGLILKLSNNKEQFDNFINNYLESEYYNDNLDEDNLEQLRYEFNISWISIHTKELVKRVVIWEKPVIWLEEATYFNKI